MANDQIIEIVTHKMAAGKAPNGIVEQQARQTSNHPMTSLSRKYPELIPQHQLKNIHPLVQSLFTKDIPNLPLAGRFSHFKENWEKLTQDQEILSVVEGYEIPF